MGRLKWPIRFLNMAWLISKWAHKGTGVGAVARDSVSRAVLETGYNGIPRGVKDYSNRMEKGNPDRYLFTAHAEENLVAHAARKVLAGSTVTVTHFCCAPCARMLINSGVARVEYGPGTTSMDPRTFEVARIMFMEAGVELVDLSDVLPPL